VTERAGGTGTVEVGATGTAQPDRTGTENGRRVVARKEVVMADVARAAGVSLQTVSRVLNGSTAVRESTRTKVLGVVDKMGYRPNLQARSLASRRTNLLGVLVVGTVYHGLAATLLAVEEAARQAGLLVTITRVAADDADGVAAAMDSIGLQRPECVVVLAQHGATVPVLLDHHDDVPMVLLLSGQQGLPGVSTVSVDQEAGVRATLEHLLARGARTVTHVAGPRSWTDATSRIAAFERLAPELGLTLSVVDARSWDAEDGYRAGREIATGKLPDAVVAANDHLALGVVAALRDSGVQVPDDVVVTGFDDVPGAGFFDPPLTTVRQDFAALGATAVASAQELCAGAAPRDLRMAPQLVVRASTGGA
jgi:DNA-binding LacI/PurR family transcriptional regulator